MKTPSTFLLALLAACIAGAQDVPAPAPAQSEMQKWFATTDEQWQATRKRDVTDVHAAELNKVKVDYLTALEAAIVKATGANDLEGAVALQNEQKRFSDTNVFLEQDAPADAASVKQLRAAIRPRLAKLERDTAIRVKALHAKYDQMLAQAQAQLTQRRRLDDALLVKAKRDEVAAAWITPAIAAALATAAPPATPTPQKTASKPTHQPKPDAGKAIQRFFVNKVWASAIGTTWAFHEDKSGWRQHGAEKWPFKWNVIGDDVVEAVEDRGNRFYFRFVSAREAYLGRAADVQDQKLISRK